MDPNNPNRTTRNAPRSAKNHTCYYWANGGCRFTEETCLYAHHETGRTANQPVRIEPGRPAVAGRNLIAAEPQHFNWHRIRHQHPSTMPHDDDMEEGEIPPSEQQQELMSDIQRRSYHGGGGRSSRQSTTSYPKPWEAAGHDAVTAGLIAASALNGTYADIQMEDETDAESNVFATHSSQDTDTKPDAFPPNKPRFSPSPHFSHSHSRALPSRSQPHSPTTHDLSTQLHALQRAYATQGQLLEEALSALEIGKDIVAEERTVLFHLEQGREMRTDNRAVRQGPMSRSLRDVMGKLDQLVAEYRALVGEIRRRVGGLGGLEEGEVM